VPWLGENRPPGVAKQKMLTRTIEIGDKAENRQSAYYSTFLMGVEAMF